MHPLLYQLLFLAAAAFPIVHARSSGLLPYCDLSPKNDYGKSSKSQVMKWALSPAVASYYTLRTGDGPSASNDPVSYIPDTQVTLYLTTLDLTRKFIGLLLYATNSSNPDGTDFHVGQWTVPGGSPFQTPSTCFPLGGSVTHTNADIKPMKQRFYFKAPKGSGKITFKILIKQGEQNKGWFWYPVNGPLNLTESPAPTSSGNVLSTVMSAAGASCSQACSSSGAKLGAPYCHYQKTSSINSNVTFASYTAGVSTCRYPLLATCQTGAPFMSVDNGYCAYQAQDCPSNTPVATGFDACNQQGNYLQQRVCVCSSNSVDALSPLGSAPPTVVPTIPPTSVAPTQATIAPAPTSAPTSPAPSTVAPTTVAASLACNGPTTFTVTATGYVEYDFAEYPGVANPPLNLVIGRTYTFNVNAPGHPFLIKTVQTPGTTVGWYTALVTNSNVDVGQVTFQPLASLLGTTLYYQCSYHIPMTNTINFVDPAVCNAATTAVPSTAAPSTAAPSTAAPTKIATTASPSTATVTPSTASPSTATATPSTAAPTKPATTANPSSAPSSATPSSAAPSTATASVSPSTATAAPSTPAPTKPPTSATPTATQPNPTSAKPSSAAPSTGASTPAPSTGASTPAPSTTGKPNPTTANPTTVTSNPTASTSAPTSNPTTSTSNPTSTPTSSSPDTSSSPTSSGPSTATPTATSGPTTIRATPTINTANKNQVSNGISSFLILFVSGLFSYTSRGPSTLYVILSISFCFLTISPMSVYGHNYIKSQHRARRAAVSVPCVAKLSNQPHVQVVPNQEFTIEWSNGHGDYTVGPVFFATVYENDYMQLAAQNITAIIQDYLKQAPASSFLQGDHWTKRHIRSTKQSDVTTYWQSYLNSSDPLFIPRDPTYGVKSDYGNDPTLIQTQLKSQYTANDKRACYSSPLYPWIECASSFNIVYLEHSVFNDEADIARFYVPGAHGPGNYVVYFNWAGYKDCVDVNVMDPTLVQSLTGSPTVPHVYGLPPSVNNSVSMVRLDHCEYTYVPQPATQCRVVDPVTRDISACLNDCKTNSYCTGVQVVRATNPAGTMTFEPNIPVNIFNGTFPYLQDPVHYPCQYFRVNDRNVNGCNTPVPSYYKCGPQYYKANDTICYGLQPFRDDNLQVSEDYTTAFELIDPVFYSTCFFKIPAGGFLNIPPDRTNIPTWTANEDCLSCDFLKKTWLNSTSWAPDWTKSTNPGPCKACDITGVQY